MKMRALQLLVLGLVPAMACRAAGDDDASRVRADVQLVADATTIEAVVPRNATFESLLRQQHLAPEMAASVVDAVRGVFNPRHLKADQSYWVTRTLDGFFREFRYEINADELLRVVFRKPEDVTAPEFNIEVVKLPKEYARAAVSAQITPAANSLIGAFKAHGENQLLPLQLAEIFSGDVDFNSDLRQGDTFDVLFDRVVRNGEFAGYGEIRAAVIETGGRRLSAFPFTDDAGTTAWYDESGQSLRRQFLRTPLPFDPRITSGFSYDRFHPVHGRRRPHLGVDFGAPTGTRVLAVAGGLVTTAAWSGEAGRLVRIKHSGGYETLYLHLSGFASGIKPGVRVNQGQVIGYVGMSGTATGPHLDYRVVENGTYRNPMTAFSRLPAGEPISAERLPEFERLRDEALQEIAARLAVTPEAASASVTR